MAPAVQRWEQQAREMRECGSVSELLARHGEPHHKELQAGFEIWHYPLGADSGMLYSVHVAVWPDGRHQAYLHMEPTGL